MREDELPDLHHYPEAYVGGGSAASGDRGVFWRVLVARVLHDHETFWWLLPDRRAVGNGLVDARERVGQHLAKLADVLDDRVARHTGGANHLVGLRPGRGD